MTEQIIDEFGMILYGMKHHRACGGALPLFTDDKNLALEHRTWVMTQLIPASKMTFNVGDVYLENGVYYIDLRK